MEKLALTTAETDLALSDSHAAQALNRAIDEQLVQMGNALARTLVDLGRCLTEMRRTKGYHYLGYTTWTKYLESKITYGQTYLSYILKIGQAGELDHVLATGISGSQLVEYARHTDYPEKLPQLIEATWEEVRDRPIRALRQHLSEHVSTHAEDFKKPDWRPSPRRRGFKGLQSALQRKLDQLDENERADFLDFLADFARENKLVAKGRSSRKL